MELAELAAYAGEKYHINEQRSQSEVPGMSVLCDPKTGTPLAYLMREWDSDSGTMYECCELKCGSQELTGSNAEYLSRSVRMQGNKWINIKFDDRTERDVVFSLFDRAVSASEQGGFTIVLDPSAPFPKTAYSDTPIPFSRHPQAPRKNAVPERLRQLRRLFDFARESPEEKAKNFCRQAVFMQDYEDDARWEGEFLCYFPTYQDMTTSQLRGYFGWRTRIRRGEFLPIPVSAAYVYIYELLNGIGAASPEESLRKMREFETGYIDSIPDTGRMRQNLHSWMFEFAVVNGITEQSLLQYAAPDIIETDRLLMILKEPDAHTDDEVFGALCSLDGKNTETSPAAADAGGRGKHLFAEVWRAAAADDSNGGRSLYEKCFGEFRARYWYPLENAVYCHKDKYKDRCCLISECRKYTCTNGIWKEEAYSRLKFDRNVLRAFMHGTDARLRRYLSTGHYLREKADEEWVRKYTAPVIRADIQAVREASRQKISLDLSGLEQIRSDAVMTRDSLLTEEELAEMKGSVSAPAPVKDKEEMLPDISLDTVYLGLLMRLLRGEPADDIIKENRLMPSIAADKINEAFFDEIGDTVVGCENDTLSLVEDYTEDLARILGGI